MIGSLLVLLAEGVLTTVWECRMRPRSRIPEVMIKRNFKGYVRPLASIQPPSPPLSMERVIPMGPTVITQASCEIPSRVNSFQQNGTRPPAQTIKWNQLTLTRPPKSIGQLLCQSPQQQQRPLFLITTESTSRAAFPLNTTHPPSDVV